MKNILYIPKMKINLLLIRILNRKKYETRFIKKKVFIINLILKITIIMRNAKNDLY